MRREFRLLPPRHHRYPGLFAATLLSGFITAGAIAGGWHDHEQIRRQALGAVQERLATQDGRIEASAERLDPRLRLPECSRALAATVPDTARESARISVEIRCDGATPWKIYVPVQVTAFRMVVVAARPLQRGKVLTADDVILAERATAALAYGYLPTPEAAVGQTLRRAVDAGAPLTASLLEAPVLVKRGQQVTLEAKSPAFTVHSAGVARSDGALGQVIAVTNVSSGKIVQAIVRSGKSVEVLLK